MQHPNIVTIHDLGETGAGDNRMPFLVMELVRGEGLDATLCRGAVALPDAARWGVQMCDALDGAHNAGIIHRDVKPSNILVTDGAILQPSTAGRPLVAGGTPGRTRVRVPDIRGCRRWSRIRARLRGDRGSTRCLPLL
ncbi:protein kinase [Streptomyces sp. NPDC001933]|uniref:protein kinase domain-containing protein n=1 Tax=Streptomyces sp. NPDC001933 TaxID=3364626 RepID=UPI0036C52D12